MAEKINILIADGGGEFVGLLEKRLNAEPDMNVVGITCDGNEALKLVLELSPDVMLLDIPLVGIDGLGVLERLRENHGDKMPHVIVLSGFLSDYILTSASSLGAQYSMPKPCDINALTSRIRRMEGAEPARAFSGFASREPQELELIVTELIRELGVPIHLAGYFYIREAVIQASMDIEMLSAVTKILYPEVAKRLNATPTQVERGIRCAIELAWKNADMEVYRKYFGPGITKKPTNSEFIAAIADRLHLSVKYGMAII